jgi:hypothetical protein
MPWNTSRRYAQRFSADLATSDTGNVLTISGVPEKGFIVRFHIVNASGTVYPILSEHSLVTDAIQDILSVATADKAIEIDEFPVAPMYYEAHNDSGTMKIYLKPRSSVNVTCSYRVDIWPAG